MLFSRKKLLEWNASSTKEAGNQTQLLAAYSSMWAEPLLALVLLLFLTIYSPAKIDVAGPILFLWLTVPIVTWWTSKPIAKQLSKRNGEQNLFFEKLARKTWSFFRAFRVSANRANWLPPDVFSGSRFVALVAHRTSPTNIGLSLLANLSANNFGYIATSQFIGRTSNTLSTMEKMERYKGHFYNWYDTESLSPLLPKYISTVDSGNLAGHLLVLRQGLLSVPHQKAINARVFEGLWDTLCVITDIADEKDTELLKSFTKDLEEVHARVTHGSRSKISFRRISQ